MKLNHGLCDVAINWSGGLHHAKKAEASGIVAAPAPCVSMHFCAWTPLLGRDKQACCRLQRWPCLLLGAAQAPCTVTHRAVHAAGAVTSLLI